MLDDVLLKRVLQRALSRGGDYSDLYIEQRRSTVIHLEDRRIEKAVEGSVSGIGLRLISGDFTAYACTNDFSEESLLELADTVRGALDGADRVVSFNLSRLNPAFTFAVTIPPSSVAMARKISLVREGEETARACGEAIRQVSVTYRDTIQKVRTVSSEGVIADDERIYTTAAVHIVAARNGMIQTGYETEGGLVGFEIFERASYADLARKAAGRALRMLDAPRAPGGRMPVVISSEAGGTMIHEAIGHGLEADLAQRGLSVYSGKRGQVIASPSVTVIDDGTLPGRRGSFVFDDEGTAAQRTVLVHEGVLDSYMYDRRTAKIDGVRSTGNGRRESFESKPIPRMTNTFVAPGNAAPDSVVSSVNNGLLVKKMGGGQVNTVTGDFVFDVQEGYLIENGRVGEMVRGATLVGNGPEVLKSIDLVGSDLGFSIGTCGKDSQGVPVSDAMPTLRIREMVVGGEVGKK